MDYGATFNTGLSYQDFLNQYATSDQRRRWEAVHQQVQLTPAQRELLGGFRREMKVLVTAGTWCGDCVQQCPIFDHFAQAGRKIQLRFFDRDAHPGLAAELAVCGAPRVPAVLFLSEDDYPCGRYGDRTLSKYRQMAADQLGPACPTGLVLPDRPLLEAVVQDWLDEFERIQLILRTSGRLRERHKD